MPSSYYMVDAAVKSIRFLKLLQPGVAPLSVERVRGRERTGG
jgi:hypothetical protein